MGFSPATPNLRMAGTEHSGQEDKSFVIHMEPAALPQVLCWKGKRGV